ncbi:hypothetical protein JTE90_015594, partial [Oedothorax gibbosus]
MNAVVLQPPTAHPSTLQAITDKLLKEGEDFEHKESWWTLEEIKKLEIQ